MLAVARETAGPGVTIDGATAAFGSELITNPAELARAADAVEEILLGAPRYAGVIVAAFGDPGLLAARSLATCPVTGIAEAGLAEAAAGDRTFAVVTTTPGLADAIADLAQAYGHAARFRGVVLTPGDPVALMADAPALRSALEEACRRAAADGADAIVIGGGPLAVAARAIVERCPVPLVEPIPAAVRLASLRAQPANTSA